MTGLCEKRRPGGGWCCDGEGDILRNTHLEDARQPQIALITFSSCVGLFRGIETRCPKEPAAAVRCLAQRLSRTFQKAEKENESRLGRSQVSAPLSFTGAGFNLHSLTDSKGLLYVRDAACEREPARSTQTLFLKEGSPVCFSML